MDFTLSKSSPKPQKTPRPKPKPPPPFGKRGEEEKKRFGIPSMEGASAFSTYSSRGEDARGRRLCKPQHWGGRGEKKKKGGRRQFCVEGERTSSLASDAGKKCCSFLANPRETDQMGRCAFKRGKKKQTRFQIQLEEETAKANTSL